MVQVARKGRVERWSGLEELRGDLRGFLTRRCPDENELDDVIHETYVRAARYRGGSKPLRLRSWLFSIARNVLLDRRRQNERYGSLSDNEPELAWTPSEAEGPLDAELYRLGRWALDRDSAMQHLRYAMAHLREGDRRVLRTFYGSGEDSRHTACECAIPPHLLKTRLFRARRRLVKTLRRRLALSEKETAPAPRAPERSERPSVNREARR